MRRSKYDFSRSERLLGYALCLGLVCVAALCSAGCGASQLQRHVRAAQASRASLDVAAVALETTCEPAAVARRTDAAERARRCLRAVESHDAARAAWMSYASALVLAADGGDVSLSTLLPLGRALVSAYSEVADALRAFGVDAPPVPALLGGP